MQPTQGSLLQPILRATSLTIRIEGKTEAFDAVLNLSFEILPQQTLALVGESGSGKTMTALGLLDLLPTRAKWVSGTVCFDGKCISLVNRGKRRSNPDMEKLRGREIAVIFQEPKSALNPVFRVGPQIEAVIHRHRKVSATEAKTETLELLRTVGLRNTEQTYRAYPHQLSGGMAQRVMIAMALSCRPRLIIADEPTTALDVTTQSQILKLIRELQERHGFGLLLISHDLEVVAQMADWTMVLRSGRMVEEGPTNQILENPEHAYTKSLVDAMFKIPALSTV